MERGFWWNFLPGCPDWYRWIGTVLDCTSQGWYCTVPLSSDVSASDGTLEIQSPNLLLYNLLLRSSQYKYQWHYSNYETHLEYQYQMNSDQAPTSVSIIVPPIKKKNVGVASTT